MEEGRKTAKREWISGSTKKQLNLWEKTQVQQGQGTVSAGDDAPAEDLGSRRSLDIVTTSSLVHVKLNAGTDSKVT